MSAVSSCLAAIHQPNFFPWLGYFDKIFRCDRFIILDNVQFPKRNGGWTNRVSLVVHGNPHWATAPVVRAYHGLRGINEMQIDDRKPWRKKLVNMFRMNYGKAPHFREALEALNECFAVSSSNLAEFNIGVSRILLDRIGVGSNKLVLASDLNAEGASTDLLISLLKEIGASAYLCGGGASEYQEDSKFEMAKIGLVYQSYSPTEYPQCNSSRFLPGQSILDAVANVGFSGTRSLLEKTAVAA
jgi:hypothetical protein